VRATQALGLCWAGALVTLFIPIAHFVLVPACLLAGPAVAWHRYQQASVVLGGTGTCPACQSDLEIVRSADRWPLEELCTQCQQQVTIARAM
jgi:hypothetical protein